MYILSVTFNLRVHSPTVGLEIIIYRKPFRRAILFFKLMEIFPNIYKKTFIFRHLVSYSSKASSHQLQSLASIPQGAARGKKLGHLFFLLTNHLYLKNIYYFIFLLSVTSGLRFRTRGSTPLSKRLPEL